ncbi:MAG TPA: hypothetical protein GX707_11540 [Epulopiscium sp.]|nr:hypothetical protein [Candidatus Epulonipiscium sp.]
MKKRLLSKIIERDASAQDVALANRTEKQYLVSCEEIKVEEEKMLLMYFYKQSNLVQGITKAEFRVFLSKDDYITQMLESPRKWRAGSLANIISSWSWNWSSWYERCTFRYIIGKDSSTNTLISVLGKTDNPMQEVDRLQKDIMADRLAKKHIKIKNRIDKQMAKIKDLPKDFDKWIDETALFHSRYIYYTYKARKTLDGYCTHCKSDVRVKGARHNKEGACPKCKSPIRYKSMGNSKNVTDNGQAALIQKLDDGIIVRYFSLSKSYGEDYKNPKIKYQELVRDIYNKKGKMKNYEWDNFKQTKKIRWCDGKGTFRFNNAVLYEKNLDKVLSGTIWQYSAIKKFGTHKKGFGFSVYDYLGKYRNYPSLEYLVKLGLYNLTNGIISIWYRPQGINLEGKTLEDVLGIDKKQLEIARRIDVNTYQLDTIKETSKANLRLTDEQILFITKHLRVEHVIEIAKYTTVHQIIKYIKTQSTKARDIGDTFRDWRDYIKNCKMLEYDLTNDFILFPRNLTAEHDRLYKYVQKNQKGIFDHAIKSMNNELIKRFNWHNGKYMVIVPKSANEITKEGQVLRHCVGTYLEGMAKGESIILFLRKKEKPQEPFYTLEISPKDFQIQQCRGMKNKSKTKEVEKVINRFTKEKLGPLNHDKEYREVV